MTARREKEALHALKAIGAAGGFFLRRESREAMGAEGRTIEGELEEIIRMLKPAEVYLPAPYERHKTHQVCTRITIDALRAAVHWPCMALGYSLWGSFWGGKERISRDIGPVIRQKVDAVIAHASQIEYKNYHQGILGKNNYEAVFMESHEVQKVSFAEIFLDMTEFLFRKDLSLKTFMREDLEKFQAAFMDFPMES
jgi:LmbE family N-acetylglucosaminyl deacetylase